VAPDASPLCIWLIAIWLIADFSGLRRTRRVVVRRIRIVQPMYRKWIPNGHRETLASPCDLLPAEPGVRGRRRGTSAAWCLGRMRCGAGILTLGAIPGAADFGRHRRRSGRAPDPGDWAGAAGGWSFLLLPCQGYGRRPSPSAEIRRPRLRSGRAGVGSVVLETSSRVVPSVRRFWRTPRSGCTRTRAERA